jgi:hypothetical protein
VRLPGAHYLALDIDDDGLLDHGTPPEAPRHLSSDAEGPAFARVRLVRLGAASRTPR